MKANITMTDKDFEVAAEEEKWVPTHNYKTLERTSNKSI
jgi:hypothetical protein